MTDSAGYKGGVPANYAIMLVGLFFFPIQILAVFFARKRRFDAVEWEMSHYDLQYRTALLYLMVQSVLFVVGVTLMYWLAGPSRADMMRVMTATSILGFIGYVPMAWLVLRSVRGLFLAGAKVALTKTGWLTIWPR